MKLMDFCQAQTLTESQPGVSHMAVQGKQLPDHITLGQSVRTRRGTEISGIVERITDDSVIIRTESGKIFRTGIHNVRPDLKEQCGCDHAQTPEPDHEVNMARADLYKLSRYAAKLHDMLTHVSEEQGLQGWQQAKITKAADYISAVYHSLDYDQKFPESQQPSGQILEGRMKDISTHQLMTKLRDAVQKYNSGEFDADRLGELTVKYANSISRDTRIIPRAVLRVLQDYVVRNIRDLTTENLSEGRGDKIKAFLAALTVASSVYLLDKTSIRHSPAYMEIQALAQDPKTDPETRAQAEKDLGTLRVHDDYGHDISGVLHRYGWHTPQEREQDQKPDW